MENNKKEGVMNYFFFNRADTTPLRMVGVLRILRSPPNLTFLKLIENSLILSGPKICGYWLSYTGKDMYTDMKKVHVD